MSTSNQPSFQTTQPVTPNSTLAITSLILGILGWTFLPILGGVIAIITDHMAKNEIKKSGGQLAGEGMATAGLILGYASVILSLCACVAVLFFPALLSGLWMFGDEILITPTP
jgi:hypothetical protein